jgi:hypothetical protein
MDKRFLNMRSEFCVGDVVNVTYNNTGQQFKGVVSFLEMAPINRSIKNGDQTDYIYVKFEDRDVYSTWLQRGSAVMVQRKYRSIQKYILCHFDDVRITAIHDDGGYLVNALEAEISADDIDSMLIWRVAYSIEKM